MLPTHLPPVAPSEADQPTPPVPAIRIGQGSGEPCAACEEPIAPGEPLEECVYPSGQVLRFHGLCYKYWAGGWIKEAVASPPPCCRANHPWVERITDV